MIRTYWPVWTLKDVETHHKIRNLEGLDKVTGVEPYTIPPVYKRADLPIKLYFPEDIRRMYYALWTGQRYPPWPWDDPDYVSIPTVPIFSEQEVMDKLGVHKLRMIDIRKKWRCGRRIGGVCIYTVADINRLKEAIKTRGRAATWRDDMYPDTNRSKTLDKAMETIENLYKKGSLKPTGRRNALPEKEQEGRTVPLSTTITPQMMSWIEGKVEEGAPYAKKGGVVYQLLLECMAEEKRREEGYE